jgi:hypothetical protein
MLEKKGPNLDLLFSLKKAVVRPRECSIDGSVDLGSFLSRNGIVATLQEVDGPPDQCFHIELFDPIAKVKNLEEPSSERTQVVCKVVEEYFARGWCGLLNK